MNTLQEMFVSSLEEVVKSEGFSGSLAELETAVSNMVPGLADSVAESMLATIRRDAPARLEERRQIRQQFEERLWHHWQKPLHLLDLFISIAIEAGNEFNREIRSTGAGLGDAVFESLTRLHARACQISSAISVLLKSGYADDAHARWRSLHEIAVVSQFICKEGKCVAEKYLLHDAIQRYKLAKRHKEHAERINDEPLSQQEFDKLKARHDSLVKTRFEEVPAIQHI